jgi:hypothetical protein
VSKLNPQFSNFLTNGLHVPVRRRAQPRVVPLETLLQKVVQSLNELKPTYDALVQTAANKADIQTHWSAANAGVQNRDLEGAKEALRNLRTALAAGGVGIGNQTQQPAQDTQANRQPQQPQTQPQPQPQGQPQPRADAQGGHQQAIEQMIRTTAEVLAKIKAMPLGMGATVAPLLEAKLQACTIETDLAQQALQLNSLQAETMQVLDLVSKSFKIARAIPKKKKDCLELLAKADSAAGRIPLALELDNLEGEGLVKSQEAMKAVNSTTAEDLKKLPTAKKIELLAGLRRGDDSTLAARKEAIAKLYVATDLDDQFLKGKDGKGGDNAKRQLVMEGLKNDAIKNAARNWNDNSLGQDELRAMREKTILSALEIQCGILKIKPMPTVKFFSQPSANVSADKKVGTAGYFDSRDGNIYLNDESASFKDFDTVLDTVIHENTHNYQHKLVEKLEAGEIKEGDEEYEQALLFQLNGGDGHFEGNGDKAAQLLENLNAGLIKKGDSDYDAAVAARINHEGYMNCPLERHAWKAGGEVSKLFVEDATAEALILIEKMNSWAKTNTKGAKQIEQWCVFVQEAIDSGKGAKILDDVRYYEGEFNSYCQQQSTQQQPDEPAALGDVEDLVDQLKDTSEQILALINGSVGDRSNEYIMDQSTLKNLRDWRKEVRSAIENDEAEEWMLGEGIGLLKTGRAEIEKAQNTQAQ